MLAKWKSQGLCIIQISLWAEWKVIELTCNPYIMSFHYPMSRWCYSWIISVYRVYVKLLGSQRRGVLCFGVDTQKTTSSCSPQRKFYIRASAHARHVRGSRQSSKRFCCTKPEYEQSNKHVVDTSVLCFCWPTFR